MCQNNSSHTDQQCYLIQHEIYPLSYGHHQCPDSEHLELKILKSQHTKIRILNTNCEICVALWCRINKIPMLINSWLRKVLKVYWLNKICNYDLWGKSEASTCRGRDGKKMMKMDRKKPTNNITTRQALMWKLQGRRKRGRPKNAMHRNKTFERIQEIDTHLKSDYDYNSKLNTLEDPLLMAYIPGGMLGISTLIGLLMSKCRVRYDKSTTLVCNITLKK